ncbi:MAG: helicase-related protein [Pseudobdellovibrionaceae bacterium]
MMMRTSDTPIHSHAPIRAILGPTNTGKTYAAIEAMLARHNGVIGFPLRLLARENYDRVVEKVGKAAVALVTGEEKIIPPHARFFLCTVESMPLGKVFEFVGVDEIQLCADPDRGHTFTDRLLHARGSKLTMFMGAQTIEPLIRNILPQCEIETRPRLSSLSYKGFKKITRQPRRSAIVAFSLDDVYRFAELIRRQKGGAAIVMGALSPRTRNAQVELFQSGEVDYLVATDAIGMGLNMDIHHVSLGATRKYDGKNVRDLTKAELAQIAGRAGRYTKDGTFGVTGPVTALDPDTVEAIQTHHFEPLSSIVWRNSDLDFSSVKGLIASLTRSSDKPWFERGREGEDERALRNLSERDEVAVLADVPSRLRLLWEVCQIPDFRKTTEDSHHQLLSDVYTRLLLAEGDGDIVPLAEDWVAGHIDRLDRAEGDIDALMTRIAHIRTWTYITHKKDWLTHAEHWSEKARAIEDKLSDSLHQALTTRFVDKRSSVLLRSLKQGEALLAGIRSDGNVIVEGHSVGQLDGFRFIPDETAIGNDRKAILSAARAALKSELNRRVMSLINAEKTQFALTDSGEILYQPTLNNPLPGKAVAQLTKGSSILEPDFRLLETDLLEGQDTAAIQTKLQGWLAGHIGEILANLKALENPENISGVARGIAYQLFEHLGVMHRSALEGLITDLDEEGRRSLRALRIKLGPVLVFLPDLNKPKSVRLRALLWSIWQGKELPPKIPADGSVSVAYDAETMDADLLLAISYPVFGPKAVRIDMLDRVINAIYDSAKDGRFKAQHNMAEWLGCSIDDLYAILGAMGHKRIAAESVEENAAPEEGAETTETVSEEAEKTVEITKTAGEVKPELDAFYLKKGQAHKKAFVKKPYEDKPKNFKPKAKPQAKGKPKLPKPDRSLSVGPKPSLEDSPFAILQQLKTDKK